MAVYFDWFVITRRGFALSVTTSRNLSLAKGVKWSPWFYRVCNPWQYVRKDNLPVRRKILSMTGASFPEAPVELRSSESKRGGNWFVLHWLLVRERSFHLRNISRILSSISSDFSACFANCFRLIEICRVSMHHVSQLVFPSVVFTYTHFWFAENARRPLFFSDVSSKLVFS